MVSPILFCGGEDIDFKPISSSFTTSLSYSLWAPDTTAARFRAGFARYALTLITTGSNAFIQNVGAFSSGSFWTTARCHAGNSFSPSTSSTMVPMQWADSGNVVRLRIRFNGTGVVPISFFVVEKINATGTITQLGSVSTDILLSSGSLISPDKFDVFINYAVTGTFTVYRNGVQIFSYSGDVTTDSQTILASVYLGPLTGNSGGNSDHTSWSEVIVSTSDTRIMSLVTQVATAPGNTDTWTAGAGATATTNTGTTSSVFTQGSEIFYQKVIPTISGPLTSLATNFNTGLTGTTQMALYSDTTFNLLVSSSVITNPTSGLQTYTVTSGPMMYLGTVYWIAFRSSASFSVLQNGSALGGFGGSQTYAASFPALGSLASTNGWMWVQWTQDTSKSPSANLTANSYNTATPDYSTTAAQIQQYTVSALPIGLFNVISVVQHALVVAGPSGPQHFEFMVRTGSTDYTSSSLAASSAWGLLTYNWDVNPNTTATWLTTDLNLTTFNLGYESVT